MISELLKIIRKIRLRLLIVILKSNFEFSQSESEIENLFDEISKIENLKEIIKTKREVY